MFLCPKYMLHKTQVNTWYIIASLHAVPTLGYTRVAVQLLLILYKPLLPGPSIPTPERQPIKRVIIYNCLGYSVNIMIHGSWGFVRYAGGMLDDVI